MSMVFLLLILLPLWLWGVTQLVRGWRERPREHAACGQCQYPVTGLETFVCPECGSDLRQVGITGTQQRTGPGPLAWHMIWLMVIAPLLMTVIAIGVNFAPRTYQTAVEWTLSPVGAPLPNAARLTLIAEGSARRVNTSSSSSSSTTNGISRYQTTLKIQPTGVPWPEDITLFHVVPAGRPNVTPSPSTTPSAASPSIPHPDRWVHQSGGAKMPPPSGYQTLKDWITARGIRSANDPNLDAACQEIQDFFTALPGSVNGTFIPLSYWQVNSVHHSSGYHSPGWNSWYPWAVVFVAALTAASGPLLYRQRRRQLNTGSNDSIPDSV